MERKRGETGKPKQRRERVNETKDKKIEEKERRKKSRNKAEEKTQRRRTVDRHNNSSLYSHLVWKNHLRHREAPPCLLSPPFLFFFFTSSPPGISTVLLMNSGEPLFTRPDRCRPKPKCIGLGSAQ